MHVIENARSYVTCSALIRTHLLPLWLLQVSQYTFAMCSYREKKAEPVELLQLDGYTVDYTDPQPGISVWRVTTSSEISAATPPPPVLWHTPIMCLIREWTVWVYTNCTSLTSLSLDCLFFIFHPSIRQFPGVMSATLQTVGDQLFITN